MIDERALRRAWAKMEARIAYLERASGLFVPDEQLDGPKGDPVVKFAPHSWRGVDYVKQPFSQCSPDFLEKLAEMLAYLADNPQEGKEKFAAYNRLDAARARSWARRLRAMHARVAPPSPEDLSL